MPFPNIGLSLVRPTTAPPPTTSSMAHALKLFEEVSPVELSELQATCLYYAGLMTDAYGVSVTAAGGDPSGSTGASPLTEHPKYLVVEAKLDEPSLELAFNYVTQYVALAYGPGHTSTIVDMIHHLQKTDDCEIAQHILPGIELTISIDADGFTYAIEVE